MRSLASALIILLALLAMTPIAASNSAACCCKTMSGDSCPLRKLTHKTCGAHEHCSMSKPADDIAAAAHSSSGGVPLIAQIDSVDLVADSVLRELDSAPSSATRDRSRAPDAPPPRRGTCLLI